MWPEVGVVMRIASGMTPFRMSGERQLIADIQVARDSPVLTLSSWHSRLRIASSFP